MILPLKDVMNMIKLSIINNNIEEQVGIESNKESTPTKAKKGKAIRSLLMELKNSGIILMED